MLDFVSLIHLLSKYFCDLYIIVLILLGIVIALVVVLKELVIFYIFF